MSKTLSLADEELLNEFEDAYKIGDYRKMAQIVCLVRGLVRRGIKVQDHLPVSELIDLFLCSHPPADTKDVKAWEELQEELYELLTTLLNQVDIPSILSTFSDLIDICLTSQSHFTQMLVVEFMTKALDEGMEDHSNAKQFLTDHRLDQFVLLMASKHIIVADRVAALIRKYPLDSLIGRLDKMAQGDYGQDGTIRVRIASLLSSLPPSQSRINEQQQWKEVANMLDDPSDDLLVMAALQMTQEAMQSTHQTPPEKILDAVFQMARLNRGEDYLKCRSMMVLTEALSWNQDPNLVADIAQVFNDQWASQPSNQVICALLPLWAKLQLATRGRSMSLICEQWNSSNMDIRIAALHAVKVIFQATSLVDLHQELYIQLCATALGGNLIDELTERAMNTLIEPAKEAAYELLSTLLRYEWIVSGALTHSHIITFLLNRDQDRTITGMHAKFNLANILLEHPQLPDHIRSRLVEYRSQGAVYSRAAPSLATESRN